MSARLVVTAGDSEGQVLVLAQDARITIGRGDTADLRIADPTVSRAHCIVECSRGKAVLKDNGSSGGTRVNGKSISTHTLQPGDIIAVGDTRLRFQSGAAAPEETEAKE